MKNKHQIGIAFLLTMFMALIYSSMAFAANGLVINDQSCPVVGDKVTFTISINNAPNNISAFGLNITFDDNILQFSKFTKGADLADFMVSANKSKTLPVLTVGGYYTGGEEFGIAAGASGEMGKLEFTVKSCEPVTIGISNQTDDIRTWQAQPGQLIPPIAPVLHAPVLQPIGNKVVMLGNTVSFTAQATDEDGDSISYSIANSTVGVYPDGANIDAQSGVFNWTSGQAGTYSVTVTASDGTGKSASEPVQITVNEPTVPHAPVVAAIAKQTVVAGSTLSLTAQATDADGDAITYSLAGLPAEATINATGNLIWTPTLAQVGNSYSVTITANDGTGRSGSATFTVEVVLASMTMNNQCCRGTGENVTFTISVSGAPNEVHSLGFELSYDENILEYKSNSKGDLTQGFELLGVSKLSSKPNTLKVGGVGAEFGIAKGSSGTILNLVFTVKSCGPAILDLAKLDDDVAGWSVKAGQLSVAPTIVCPGNIVVEAEGANGASAGNTAIQDFLNGASAHDVMNNPLAVTTNAPAVFALGNTEVTFTAVDGAGNSASCKATVRVRDVTPPAITCPADITVDAEDATGTSAMNAAIQAFLKLAIATDAVGVVSVTTNAPAKFPMGMRGVTFTIADGAGNKTSCIASVTVADRTAPVLSCPPGNITVTAEGPNGASAGNAVIQAFLNGASALDNIDGSVKVTNNAASSFGIGKTDVKFSATDKAGNTSNCTATVTVRDNTAPVITCPPPPAIIKVEAEGPNGVPANRSAIQDFLNAATAMDAEDGAVSVTNNAPAAFALGNTQVTFSAKDSAGNLATCTATVIVVDTTDPVITCPVPASISVEAEGPNGTSAGNAAIQAFFLKAAAMDAIDGKVNVTNNAPAVFGIGSRNVTFSARDKSGNTDSCTATVTVIDTIDPVITCPAPASITVEAEGANGTSVGNAAIQALLNGTTATDKVDGWVSVTNNAQSVFGLGSTQVIFAATDNAFNTSNCTAIVTVVDTMGPAITCPANITVAADGTNGIPATNAAIQAFLNGAAATDKVDGSLTVTNNAPAVFSFGDTVVTFSAKDKTGNTATRTATVNVGDKIAPVITCPAAITVETTSDGVLATATKIKTFLSGAKATDAVDGAVTITNNAPAKFSVGKTDVSFSATDKSGNTSSCKSTVTITKTGSSTGSLLGSSLYSSSSSYGNSLYSATQAASAPVNLYQSFNQNMFSFQQLSLPLYQPSSTWNWSLNQQPTAWNFTTTLWPPAWSPLY